MPINPVRGIGPADGDPAWIIIGEGPGHNEVRQGRPWVGESGQVLNKALALVGRDRNTLHLTNATLCIPTKGSDVKARFDAAKACRPRLLRELAELPAVPVLTLGAPAATTVLPTSLIKITDLAGTFHRVDIDGTGRMRVVVPSVHPAAILRGGGEVKGAHASEIGFWNLHYDVAKVELTSRGRDIELDLSRIQTEVRDAARANDLVNDFVASAWEHRVFALDLETYVDDDKRHDARQPRNARIRTIGLATEDVAISVQWRLLKSLAFNQIKDLLASPEVTKIGHNAILYDRVVFENRYHRFACKGEWVDTMLMHHATFPGANHRLQAVGCQFYGLPPWKSEHREQQDTDEENADYNVKDTAVTLAIVAPLRAWIKKRGVEGVFADDTAMAWIAGGMHLRGVPIDSEINRELDYTFRTSIDSAYAKIQAEIGARKGEIWQRLALQQSTTKRKKDPDDIRERFTKRYDEIVKQDKKRPWVFNPNSANHVIALLRTLGAKLYKLTDKGRISVDSEVLDANTKIPIVAALVAYRDNQTLYRTFVRSMYDNVNDKGEEVRGYVEPDGRVYPSWTVHKITGRWGSSDPMVQNWSKGDPMYCRACGSPVICIGFDAYDHLKLKEPCLSRAAAMAA